MQNISNNNKNGSLSKVSRKLNDLRESQSSEGGVGMLNLKQ